MLDVQSSSSDQQSHQLQTTSTQARARHRRARTVCLAAAAAAAVAGLTSPAARAANATWDGGGSDPNFGNIINWVSDTVPAAGDTLTFDGFTRMAPNNDLAAGFLVGGITFAP